MRIAKIENYKNDMVIDTYKIKEIPEVSRNINILNEKDKIKFIKTVESVVRGSQEYKQYIAFLKKEIDMTMCSFFNNVTNKDQRRISIEIHHEPFTLYDIAKIIVDKWIALGEKLNPILIAEEVMKIHYQNKVGLIPLSVTVHVLVHDGKLIIPLQNVYGNFISFLEEYDQFISNDLKEVLEIKLRMSKDVENHDMSILEKKYLYLEVDGMTFPQPLSETIEK